MAKARGGLGRGLNSLLGGGSEALPPEIPEYQDKAEDGIQTNPIEVEQSEPNADDREVVDETADDNQQNVAEEERNSLINEEIVEDNIKIKGVVERPAAPARRPLSASYETQVKEVDEVDIRYIFPNPDQPRTNFKKEELDELAQSIKRNGLLQPLVVRKTPEGTYQIVAGERRFQACQQLKMEKVPVKIVNASDDDMVMLALVENVQRTDLNPIEEAYGYRRMMERGKMTQSEVAQAVSKGRSTIANALRLLELPEDAQRLIYEERITAGHARAILSVPTQDGRRKITDKLMETHMSVRETEIMARLLAGKKEKRPTPREPVPKSYKTVARALKDALETEVKVKSSKGKNRIEIGFKDEADLERLFRKIMS